MKSRKEQIKDAAAYLFRKKGYKATSMKDIADAMDIKAASLYNHIKSKQELLSELSLEIAHAFTNGLTDIENSSLTGLEKLKKIVGLHVRLTIDHTDAIALVTSEWVHLEETYDEYLSLRVAYENRFKKIIEACIEEGDIAEVQVDIAIFSVLSSLHWLYSWYSKNKDKIGAVELENQMVKCLIEGLIKR